MFVTQGPIDPESSLFTGRAAELKRMESWLPHAHCVGAVLGARQTGKTSLLLKLRHTLRAKYAFVFVDLEAVAQAELTECLSYVANEITDQLAEQTSGPEQTVLKEPKEFLSFLARCARAAHGVRIVVLLDEIGALLPDTALRLSSAIRAVFTTRHVKPEFAHYTFVLAGGTDMLELTTGRNSPLKNVADSLYLGDLSASETDQLVSEMLGDTLTAARRKTFQTLHDWTAGHPYWTQLLGQALDRQPTEITEAGVKDVVEQLLHTEDRNLPHLFHAIEADAGLWELVGALLDGTPIRFTRANPAIAKLELIGLVKNENGRCDIRNRIYREALERHPVRRPRVLGRNLHRLTQRLLASPDLDALLQTVTADLQSSLQNRSVITFVKRVGDGGFSVASSVGLAHDADVTLPADSRLASILVGPIEPKKADLTEVEGDVIERLGVKLIVPVRLKSEAVAFIWLGRKLSSDEYDAQDHEFLSAVAEQTAAGFDRMRLRALERDAQRAWEIQQGFLPKEFPEVAGLQIDGSLQPARVVAGDYYDALKLGERTLAVCIADVV